MSSGVLAWHKASYKALERASSDDYLFDPTVLVSRIMRDLIVTLDKTYKLDVTSKNVLVPLCFVRCWADKFTSRSLSLSLMQPFAKISD